MSFWNFEPSTIFVVLLAGAGLIVVGRLTFVLLGLIPNQITTFVRRHYSYLAAIVLCGYAFWVVQLLMRDNRLLAVLATTAVFVMFFWWGFVLLRDTFAGLMFKWTKSVCVGDVIHADKFEGRVVALKIRHLELETSNAKIVCIPYTLLTSQPIVKTNHTQLSRCHTFRLEIDKNQEISTLIEQITTCAVQSPWASITDEPRIALVQETDKTYTLDVTVFSIAERYGLYIEHHIRKKLA